MRKLRIIIILALAVMVSFSSCSKKQKREKITDPVQQEALRTRDQSIPIDSLFTGPSMKKIASPFKKIAIGKLFTEWKATTSIAIENGSREKYADKLIKKDGMKKDAAKKAADKVAVTELEEYKPNFLERVVLTKQNLPSDGYSASLTIYFLIVLVAFVIIFTTRVIKAFFVKPE